MRTAVDTNVLLDLLAGDDAAIGAARGALVDALGRGSLTICPVVYAELAASFPSADTLERFLAAFQLRLDGFSREALTHSAAAWKQYARARGKDVQCPRCGHRMEVGCPNCGETISWRQHVILDFLVGGHAAVQADRLLTRDPHFYRRYFPSLELVSP